MNQAAVKGTANLSSRRRKQLLHGTCALLAVGLLGIGLALAVRQSHIQHQMQTDPEVATVWLLQVTHGPNHTLTRGSTVQRWANQHGLHALGDYQVLTGSFNGEPNGLEFWFDYDSHTSIKELECHRVGPTAFVDEHSESACECKPASKPQVQVKDMDELVRIVTEKVMAALAESKA